MTDEAILAIIKERDKFRDATLACHAYFMECARRWHNNEGRVSETLEGGAIVVGKDLDTIADTAARMCFTALGIEFPREGADD